MAAFALIFSIFPSGDEKPQDMDITAVAEAVRLRNVESISAIDNELLVTMHNGETFQDRKDDDISLLATLQSHDVGAEDIMRVQINVKSPSQASNWLALLSSIAPLIFVGALPFFFLAWLITEKMRERKLVPK